MTRRRALMAGWILVLGLCAVLPVSALFHGVVHIGSDSLVMRDTLNKPLISIASDVVLQRGTKALVVCIGCDIRLHATATDDLVDVGGKVYLGSHSRVNGDVLSIAGGIYKAPDAVASGRLGGALHPWNGNSGPGSGRATGLIAGSVRLGLAAGVALLLIGICLTVIFPWQVVLIATTLKGNPVKSAAAGITNLIIFVFLAVPLGLSLVGLPFAVLLAAAASLAWLFGVTACAVVLGRFVSRGTVSLLWASAAGLVVVACSMAVPLVGPLAISAIGLTGTGALAVALLSRSRPASPLA